MAGMSLADAERVTPGFIVDCYRWKVEALNPKKE